MTTSRLSHVRRLVELVHDLPADERSRVLERECGTDAALRAEVEAVLDAAEESPDFLARERRLPAAIQLARGPGIDLAAGARIGPFRLLGRIATGGMGTVWEAEQDSPHRVVALKTLRFADLSPEATRRFRHESEILARLRHPNIAQVFASGVHEFADGERLPWYALEHVQSARALTDYAQARGLDLNARLELFARLCDAVQHAHDRGVVHRDLKPSNVLVDEAGELKVIDFGVARVRAASGLATSFHTEVGSVIGTLQYMAPEQLNGAGGEVDARSDVYSLGVILYELVTGALPHDLGRASLAEAARILAEHAPARPRALVARLATDVDAIVLGALEKEPARRYASAAALAADVRRHLRGESVLAHPPSAVYQLRVLARRHRAAVAAAAVILLVSLGAAIVSLGYAWRARAAERLATRRFEDVRSLARSVLFDLHDSIEHLPGATQARHELADTALHYLDQLERETGDDPGLLAEIAEGRLRVGLVLGAPGHAGLGRREEGTRELERALAACDRRLAIGDSDAILALRVRVLVALGNFERASGRLERAAELCARAVREAGAVRERDPDDAGRALGLSAARAQHAKVLALLGRSAEAKSILEGSRDELRRLRERSPESVEPLHNALVTHVDLAILLHRELRLDEALAELDEALALAEEHVRRAPDDAQATGDLALALTWRGRVRAESGELDPALADLERGVELRRALAARDPHDATAVRDLSFACVRLAAARSAAGDPEGALAGRQEALELSRRALERAPRGFDERLAVASDEQGLAETLLALGRSDEAKTGLERARDALLELEAEQPGSLEAARQLATVFLRRADEARQQGRLEEALDLYGDAGLRIERAATDRSDAWARRMQMVVESWRGVAHLAAADQAAEGQKRAHYERATDAFQSALDLEQELAQAGFLTPGDSRAVEAIRADLDACRLALAGPSTQ